MLHIPNATAFVPEQLSNPSSHTHTHKTTATASLTSELYTIERGQKANVFYYCLEKTPGRPTYWWDAGGLGSHSVEDGRMKAKSLNYSYVTEKAQCFRLLVSHHLPLWPCEDQALSVVWSPVKLTDTPEHMGAYWKQMAAFYKHLSLMNIHTEITWHAQTQGPYNID